MGFPLPAVVLVLACAATAGAAPKPAPNLVVILMDDMGWRDIGCMGDTFVETPHIDRMATTGVVFTQAYASAPNCAPTRACLMSGQWTPRHGIYTVVDPRQPPGSPWHKIVAAKSESELATEVVTLPEALAARGYATAFLGMWNLGRGRSGPRTPGGQGFDTVVFPENLGFSKDAYFDDQGRYLSDRLTDEVLDFIAEHRSRPFFVYLADHAVHAPFNPKPDLLAKYTTKAAAGSDRRDDPACVDTIEAVDQNVGRIVPARLAARDEGRDPDTGQPGVRPAGRPPPRPPVAEDAGQGSACHRATPGSHAVPQRSHALRHLQRNLARSAARTGLPLRRRVRLRGPRDRLFTLGRLATNVSPAQRDESGRTRFGRGVGAVAHGKRSAQSAFEAATGITAGSLATGLLWMQPT